MTDNKQLKRVENALWGIFIGDALAMPVHLYYDTDNITKAFGRKGIRTYEDPKEPHKESRLTQQSYRPDVETAHRLGRNYDILGTHVKFYDTSYAHTMSPTRSREGHVDDRVHYHHGLMKGENTVSAELVRVLMRSVIRHRRYDRTLFLNDFVEFMTASPPKDPFREEYLRLWFEGYSKGYDAATQCAADQLRHCNINSMGGMIRPLVLSLLANSAYEGVGAAIEHLNLTHRSPMLTAAIATAAPLADACIRGRSAEQGFYIAADVVRIPSTSGAQLASEYKKNKGPEKVAPDRMWELHNRLDTKLWDLRGWVQSKSLKAATERLSTGCDPEHGLPLALYLGAKHNFDFQESLLANANVGGDNVHRGSVLGFLLGSASDEIPHDLRAGLAQYPALQNEITEFARLAVDGGARF